MRRMRFPALRASGGERTPAGRAATLMLALIAGACVGPTYRRPAVTIPAAYTSPQSTGAPDPDLTWWEHFNAPELNDLIGRAARLSPDLAAATARVVQADQAARVAGSPLLPTVNGVASQSWERAGIGSSSSSFSLPGGSHYIESRSYSAELQASYEIDFWGKNLDQLRAAEASALASRYDRQTVWLTAASSIATTYFQAIGYRDRLAIARRNVSDASRILDAYRARLVVGTASALDVSQQEALVAGYKAQIPALESLFRQQEIALGILVGEPPEAIHLGQRTLTTLALPSVNAGLPASVLRRRPDVANAEELLVAQNQTVRQDVANLFPSLVLTGTGGVSSAALSMITGPGSLIASLASSLTQTIFDNGLKLGTLGEARGRFQELAADYIKAFLQALTDVETALTQVSYAATQEAAEAEAVRTARRSADIAATQLQVGTVDLITVLNTEATLFNDQDALAQVRISRFLAAVSLYKALGGGWQGGVCPPCIRPRPGDPAPDPITGRPA